jgi:hypothetical protein
MELLSDFPLLLSPFLRLDAADATGGPWNQKKGE